MKKEITVRLARESDVARIVELLADDFLGGQRERYEQPIPDSYMEAFKAIDEDRNNELIVACYKNEVVGVLQITYTPQMTYQGGWRATIEGVMTSSTVRGKGVGSVLMKSAIERAKERGCHLAQLTTNKKRPDALRFYEKLGFEASHHGLKLHL